MRGVGLRFGGEQVAAEGGHGEAGDDGDPGGEEKRSGVEEKRVGRHECSSVAARLGVAMDSFSGGKSWTVEIGDARLAGQNCLASTATNSRKNPTESSTPSNLLLRSGGRGL